MEEQWINDLRKKMASHQTPVPPELWKGIEAALPIKKTSVTPLHRKVWFWTTAFSSAAALLALFFLLDRAPGISPQLLVGNFPTAPTPPAEKYAPSLAPPIAQLALPAPLPDKALQGTPQPSAILLEKSGAEVPPISSTAETDTQTAVPSEKSDAATSRPLLADAAPASETRQPASPKRKRRAWDLQFYTGNLPHTTHRNTGYGELVAGMTLPHHPAGELPEHLKPVKDIIYANRGKEIQTRKKHKLPLTFGLTLRYHLTPRLSLESGLTYTYLASELTSGTDDHHFVTHQKLQYLGLPLSLNYDVWANEKWNFYASAGGTLEKCIHGTSSTDYTLHRQPIASDRQHVMERPLQCAVNAALGAQFNFSSHVSLYAQPGISYYFDNGSPVETIYKDQPLNFNFKLGFRYTFR